MKTPGFHALLIHSLLTAVAGLVLATLLPGPAAAEAPTRELEKLFESRVRPLLIEKCQGCHGEKIAEAGLRLDSRRSLMAGGDDGPVVKEHRARAVAS
jgi:hypothetical protein